MPRKRLPGIPGELRPLKDREDHTTSHREGTTPVTNPRLTAENLHGIWAGVTMPWDENDQFDEEIYATNIRRTIDTNVHGIYTTGSTGEFYAVDDDEFRRMGDIQAELCGMAGMPLQIGCCSDGTVKALQEWLKQNYPQFVYPE